MINDELKVTPFPNIVGGGTQLLGFAENQQVVADDFDADGRLRFVGDPLGRRKGPALDLFTRDVSGNYRKQASSFFLWKAVSSIAMLDFDADGNLDLALLFRDSPNLFIYKREGQEFKYLKEIVLPFEPSVVVDSLFEGFPRERRLHVFDASFHRVATLTSSNPGIFLLGLPGSQSFKSYQARW